VAAVILGVPVMALHMISMYSSSVRTLVMKPAMCHGGVTAGQIIMVLLNVPLQFGVGYRFYRSAILGNNTSLPPVPPPSSLYPLHPSITSSSPSVSSAVYSLVLQAVSLIELILVSLHCH
jgi:hypothetical protein